jgi:hypothetical protein
VFWRLSEEERLPGRTLKAPMVIMLDGLRSERGEERRCAEGWLRTGLRSYVR